MYSLRNSFKNEEQDQNFKHGGGYFFLKNVAGAMSNPPHKHNTINIVSYYKHNTVNIIQ